MDDDAVARKEQVKKDIRSTLENDDEDKRTLTDAQVLDAVTSGATEDPDIARAVENTPTAGGVVSVGDRKVLDPERPANVPDHVPDDVVVGHAGQHGDSGSWWSDTSVKSSDPVDAVSKGDDDDSTVKTDDTTKSPSVTSSTTPTKSTGSIKKGTSAK